MKVAPLIHRDTQERETVASLHVGAHREAELGRS
jgi:hypothetical protein